MPRSMAAHTLPRPPVGKALAEGATLASMTGVGSGEASGLKTDSSVSAGTKSAATYTRAESEVVWRQPTHRLILPLRGLMERRVTVAFEGGPAVDVVCDGQLAFFPANVKARTVTATATLLHVLWSPDPATAGRLEPLIPFQDPLIDQCGKAIASELESEAPDPLLVESLCNAMILKLSRRFLPRSEIDAPHASGLSRSRVQRVVDYIEAHLADVLTLDAIAAVACLSPHHLSRSFRRAMGTGLHRYIVHRRIERAKELVISTDLPISQIAWTVGFESQAAFTTRFRREYGCPPTHLRRRA